MPHHHKSNKPRKVIDYEQILSMGRDKYGRGVFISPTLDNAPLKAEPSAIAKLLEDLKRLGNDDKTSSFSRR